MTLIILTAVAFILLKAKPLNATTNVLDIDYLPSTNLSSFHSDCDLSFDLSVQGVAHLYPILLSNNENVIELLLHWIHSHIFTLIDSSFLYNVDEYTDDFWSEYYLHLITISNSTGNTVRLSIDICVTQPQALHTLESELNYDDEEIAAFIRYKLSDHIQTYHQEITIDNIHVSMMIVNAISTTQSTLFVPDATSPDRRRITRSALSSTTTTSLSTDAFVFTENMFYVAIIGFVMIISTMVVTVFCVLCIKQATDKRLQTALHEIESHSKRNGTDKKGKPLGTNDMTSIEPLPIPNHLVSIDTGLNVENILEQIDDQSSDSSINIQRNKLGLKSDTYSRSKKHLWTETDSHVSEVEQLNASPVLVDDLLSSSPSSMRHALFMEDTDCRGIPLQSMSARLSHHLSRKKEDMNIIYNPLRPQGSLPDTDSRDTQIRYKAKDNKHPYAKRHSTHNIARKPYAKRKESKKRSARSQSKPNLRLKKKRHKPKLSHTCSQREVFAHNQRKRKRNQHNARYSLQIEPASYSNKPRNVFSIREHELSPNSLDNELSLASVNKANSLSVHSSHHMMLYEHKESVDVDAIEFDVNGHVKIDANNLKELDPPIPNPPHLDTDMVNRWESESESSIVCKTQTPTTKGSPEGDMHQAGSNSDAHSQTRISNHSLSTSKSNPYKGLQVNKERVILTQKIPFSNPHDDEEEDSTPPPPPPPPLPPPPPVVERDGVIPPISLQSSIQSSNYSQTVLIRVAHQLDEEEEDEEGREEEEEDEDEDGSNTNDNIDDCDAKFDTLSTIAVQSTVLPYYAPNL